MLPVSTTGWDRELFFLLQIDGEEDRMAEMPFRKKVTEQRAFRIRRGALADLEIIIVEL